jgi:tRNA-dihydrouridine synthase C
VVNRHGGGAALLDEPELVAKIVSAVRRAVPAHMPVSAKMRLGYMDDSRAVECALAIAESGANELVVHARTKAQAYNPPAYWHRIADIRAAVTIPVVANGEIWTVADAQACMRESGCTSVMLGRGAVVDPGLARAIRGELMGGNSVGVPDAVPWGEVLALMHPFWHIVCSQLDAKKRAGRMKQWLNFLRRRYSEAEVAYQALKTARDADVTAWLKQHAGGIHDVGCY